MSSTEDNRTKKVWRKPVGVVRATSIIAAIGLAVSIFSATPARAADLRIPATMYPTGAHIWYSPSVSNNQLDCQWGFFCEGPVPLFHFHSQDAMHRLSGWGQSAAWHGHHRQMQFVVYCSRYAEGTNSAGMSWSRVALNDLIYATRTHHYRAMKGGWNLVPSDKNGQSVMELQRSGTEDLIVMAAASGSQEVEGLTVFNHRYAPARRAAIHDLSRQVIAAMIASPAS